MLGLPIRGVRTVQVLMPSTGVLRDSTWPSAQKGAPEPLLHTAKGERTGINGYFFNSGCLANSEAYRSFFDRLPRVRAWFFLHIL